MLQLGSDGLLDHRHKQTECGHRDAANQLRWYRNPLPGSEIDLVGILDSPPGSSEYLVDVDSALASAVR